MKNKKIAFFIDSFSCGGAEKSLLTLLNNIHKDYIIDLYVLSKKIDFDNNIPDNIRLKIISTPKISLYLRIKKKFLQTIIHFIDKRKFKYPREPFWKYYKNRFPPIDIIYDIAIAYHQGFPTYFVIEKVNAKKKIAWINSNIIKAGYNKKFNLYYYNQYDYIVTSSNPLKEIIKKNYQEIKNKLININDIINTEDIEKKSLVFNPFISNPDIFKIVTVGRLVPVKGYDIAIEAAKILKNKNIQFKWYFIGEGIYRNTIENLINKNNLNENIELKGLQKNPYPFIRNCDLYVQPSYTEGNGITVFEAKVLNKPIIATNFEVVENLITHMKNGLICEKNGEDLANKIIFLMNNEELKNKFKQNLNKETINNLITELQKFKKIIK